MPSRPDLHTFSVVNLQRQNQNLPSLACMTLNVKACLKCLSMFKIPVPPMKTSMLYLLQKIFLLISQYFTIKRSEMQTEEVASTYGVITKVSVRTRNKTLDLPVQSFYHKIIRKGESSVVNTACSIPSSTVFLGQ